MRNYKRKGNNGRKKKIIWMWVIRIIIQMGIRIKMIYNYSIVLVYA